MKLVSLNVWVGREYEALGRFLTQLSHDVDIFCFQEVFHDGLLPAGYDRSDNMEVFSDLKRLLPCFSAFLAPPDSREDSLAIFVRNGLIIEDVSYFFVSTQPNGEARTRGIPLQYIRLRSSQGKQYTICNYHGWWIPDSKADSPERLVQSRLVRDFLDTIAGPKLICGDFNLSPDTQSMSIIDKGMRNLIRDYCVSSTRSHLSKKAERFADYIVLSPDIDVLEFAVMQDVVSDHLPLCVTFD